MTQPIPSPDELVARARAMVPTLRQRAGATEAARRVSKEVGQEFLEAGFFRREIADAAFTYQREVDAKRKLIVGVNAFQETDEKPIETMVADETVEKD